MSTDDSIPDLDALGVQYREAKAAIGTHRQRQADAELAFADAMRLARGDRSALAVVDAQAAVDRAVADVEWCKAATLAAGEAYKGEALDVILERNDAHGTAAKASHQRTVNEHNGLLYEGR